MKVSVPLSHVAIEAVCHTKAPRDEADHAWLVPETVGGATPVDKQVRSGRLDPRSLIDELVTASVLVWNHQTRVQSTHYPKLYIASRAVGIPQ
jgi:hypothetical protein